jgi:hypothetical protein
MTSRLILSTVGAAIFVTLASGCFGEVESTNSSPEVSWPAIPKAAKYVQTVVTLHPGAEPGVVVTELTPEQHDRLVARKVAAHQARLSGNAKLGSVSSPVVSEDGTVCDSYTQYGNFCNCNEDSLWIWDIYGSPSEGGTLNEICFQGSGSIVDLEAYELATSTTKWYPTQMRQYYPGAYPGGFTEYDNGDCESMLPNSLGGYGFTAYGGTYGSDRESSSSEYNYGHYLFIGECL